MWRSCSRSPTPDGDTAALHGRARRRARRFRELYAEAEAIAQSSVTAAKRRKGQAAQAGAPAPPTLRVRIARRVPKRYRKRAVRALRRLRGSRS